MVIMGSAGARHDITGCISSEENLSDHLKRAFDQIQHREQLSTGATFESTIKEKNNGKSL